MVWGKRGAREAENRLRQAAFRVIRVTPAFAGMT